MLIVNCLSSDSGPGKNWERFVRLRVFAGENDKSQVLKNVWSGGYFYIIFQYFQTKYNFHAVLYEHQLKKIRGIFKPEKMKIRPSEIKLPQQLSLKWETVGGPDRKGRCYNEIKWKN